MTSSPALRWLRTGGTRAHVILVLFLSLAGCMDRNADELLTPHAVDHPPVAPDRDVLMAGRREVLYDFASPRGAAVYELVVNDSLQGSFPAGVDGSQPSIIWQVDTALVSSEVQYFLRYTTMTGTPPPAAR